MTWVGLASFIRNLLVRARNPLVLNALHVGQSSGVHNGLEHPSLDQSGAEPLGIRWVVGEQQHLGSPAC